MKKFVELLLWLRNFVAPFFVSLIVAFIVYLATGRSTIGIVLAIIFLSIGAFIGYRFAEKVRKKYGSDLFNAVPMATTDLKHLHDEE